MSIISRNQIVISTLLLISTFSNAQNPEFISGRVLDAKTNEPIPFAHIWLQANKLGVVANAEADFQIQLSQGYLLDSIVLSSIGYKQYKMAVQDLLNKQKDPIFLQPATYDLDEIRVYASLEEVNSRKIIRRALRKISDNRPNETFSFVSYYRDYLKRNGEYYNLNEALVHTYDKGFMNDYLENRHRLIRYRSNENFKRINVSPYYDTTSFTNPHNRNKVIPRARLGDQYGNELLILLVHDAIRNHNSNSYSFVDTLTKDFLYNHDFSQPVPIYYDKLQLFKIDFTTSSRIKLDTLEISGSVYIEPENYSIHKLTYNCGYVVDNSLKKIYSIDTEYGYSPSLDSLLTLKYISFSNAFHIIDTSDQDYFRIEESYWKNRELSRPTMVFSFNHKIDTVSSVKKKNFQIYGIEDPPGIRDVWTSGEKLYIKLNRIEDTSVLENLKISMFHIKDIHGKHLNQPRELEFYQYRELFVQDYQDSIAFQDDCFIKSLPLEKNCVSISQGAERYWMNTPTDLLGNE